MQRVTDEHSNDTIKEFRIAFGLGAQHSFSIDSWFRFAFRKQVENLELNLYGGNRYEFPNVMDPVERLRAFNHMMDLGVPSIATS